MGKWYILHVRTGQEDKIKKLLESQLNKEEQNIKQILIPKEEIAEILDGERKVKNRRYWPGYMLIEIDDAKNNEVVWHAVRTIQGVLGFLGAGATPVPLTEVEVNKILKEIEGKKGKPVPKVRFSNGEKVEIIDGPFVNFPGIVEEVFPDKERLKVSVSIFGRATLLELAYWQVERI